MHAVSAVFSHEVRDGEFYAILSVKITMVRCIAYEEGGRNAPSQNA